ncbi:MAG: hypothetical protein U1C72_02735, partial [Candidatus Pacearchaeota archaeon]|nr:hypothetical protein [Candidatus Pacearchaeota archaeon]
MHGAIWDPPPWYEKWIGGEKSPSLGFEITSDEGEINLYVRVAAALRPMIESALYAQFPGIEIEPTDDYTTNAPQDMPNKEWDLFAWNYRLLNSAPFPIKTYKDFETEQEKTEEQKIDPIVSLLEGLSTMGPGEHMWLQILTSPISEEYRDPFNNEAQSIVNKLTFRKPPKKPTSFLQEMFNTLVTGPSGADDSSDKDDRFPPELRMTPGERDTVKAIEEKMYKPVFKVVIRAMYFGKRDVFFKPKIRIILGFTSLFHGLNEIQPWGRTFRVRKNLKPFHNKYLRPRKLY